MTVEFSSPHTIGPRQPDLDATELKVYEEEVRYLETREWGVVMGCASKRYSEIVKEAKGR